MKKSKPFISEEEFKPFTIEEISDKSFAREVKASFENSIDQLTDDLKAYLAYQSYDPVIEVAKILNIYKKGINDINEKFKL